MKLITFFWYFYFHRFPQCPNLRGWNSHSFSTKVLHVLSWETSTSTAAVFFKCYATKQDLLKLGWRIVGKHSRMYQIMFSRHCTSRIGPPILGWTIVTPQGHYGSSSHVMLQAPLESGTFQDSTASVLDALIHPIMISNSTDFSYFKSQLTKHLKTKARARLLS